MYRKKAQSSNCAFSSYNLIQEILIPAILSGELLLRTDVPAERFPVPELLDIVQSAGDPPIPVRIERKERD